MYGRTLPRVGEGTWRDAARRSRWLGHAQRAGAALLASACVGCGAALPWGASPLLLCADCLPRLRAPSSPACRQCGRPLPAAPAAASGREQARCGACREHPPPWEALVAAFLYRPPLVGVVRALKFRRAEPAGAALAAALAERCRPWRDEIDAVVPVPLAWTRLLLRGYNQAEAIAAPLAAALELPLRRPLRRRARRRQALLGRGERRRNLRGAFSPRGGAAPPATVLLVDDVMTTGATLEAAARALRRAGAGRVLAAVAARTPERSWDEPGEAPLAVSFQRFAGD